MLNNTDYYHNIFIYVDIEAKYVIIIAMFSYSGWLSVCKATV